MTDSNRNLAAKVLQLLGDIARAMGPVSGARNWAAPLPVYRCWSFGGAGC